MRPMRTRRPLTRPGAVTANVEVTETLAPMGLGTSTEAWGLSGPGEPVGTVKGIVASPPSVCRWTAKSRLMPHGAVGASEAANGVVLAVGTPKLRSGQGEAPW